MKDKGHRNVSINIFFMRHYMNIMLIKDVKYISKIDCTYYILYGKAFPTHGSTKVFYGNSQMCNLEMLITLYDYLFNMAVCLMYSY